MERSIDENQMHLCRSCGPVLLAVKPAALIAISREEANILEKIKPICPLSFMFTCEKAGQIFAFVPELMDRVLGGPGVLCFLKSLGYNGNTAEDFVSELVHRIRKYWCLRRGFPHELGIFLGYPLEDVTGFVTSGGRNARMEGEWKVYSDIGRAVRIQGWHRRAVQVMENALRAGIPLEKILMDYWDSPD